MSASMTSRRLPVLATTMSVYKVTFENRGYALRIAWPWLAVFMLFSLILLIVTENGEAESLSRELVITFIGLVLVSMAGWSSIAVLWHRRLLRDEAPGGTPVDLSKRSLNYLLRFTFIAIVVGIPIAIVEAFGDGLVQVDLYKILEQMTDTGSDRFVFVLASLAAAAVFGIFSLRLSVALPAAALERDNFLPSTAWDATAGNGIRLLMIGILAGGPILLVITLFDQATEAFGMLESNAGMLIYVVLIELLNFVWVMLGITLLSIAFALLAENRALEFTDEPVIP